MFRLHTSNATSINHSLLFSRNLLPVEQIMCPPLLLPLLIFLPPLFIPSSSVPQFVIPFFLTRFAALSLSHSSILYSSLFSPFSRASFPHLSSFALQIAFSMFPHFCCQSFCVGTPPTQRKKGGGQEIGPQLLSCNDTNI